MSALPRIVPKTLEVLPQPTPVVTAPDALYTCKSCGRIWVWRGDTQVWWLLANGLHYVAHRPACCRAQGCF